MAGHIQDRWYRAEVGPDGKTLKVKTERYGTGMRYRARYIGPDGTERSKSFPDKQKRLADSWLTNIEADMARGQYIDPKAGRTTFREYAERWLGALTTDLTSRAAVEPALASAGIIPTPEKGQRYASAREHGMHALRHFYPSVLLDAGQSIKALSLYLGHSDPGFTLRVYTHLMPSSETRIRKAISAMYRAAGHAHDSPETAQAA
ncbi:hypothetical protein ACWCY6_32780 [Streptomyces sp. 900105755]